MQGIDITSLLTSSPREWLHNATTVAILVMIAGRGWAAWKNGGGLSGVWRTFIYGSAHAEKPTPPLTPPAN